PHKLFNIFSDLCRKVHADDQVDKALRTLQKEEIHLLFEVFNILSPLEILEIKGISELLESLIPYSQRHFSRIDRLIRSTLLLDYTLSAMSVIEPESEVNASKEISVLQHEEVNEPGVDDVSQEQVQTPFGIKEKKSSKKRKSGKSRTGAEKKVRESAYTDASAISLQA
ncbi:transducin beta-like protein, partial [Thalictrum thalictroides]